MAATFNALVCVHAHHGFAKGALVTDPKKIDAILSSDKEHHFNKLNLPVSPTPHAPVPVAVK